MSERTCSVEGCTKDAKKRGWCDTHYQRWRTKGNPGGANTSRTRLPCLVEGCERPSVSGGLCEMHSRRLKKTGDPGPAGTIRPRQMCASPGCDRKARGRGLCLMHYRRAQRSGDAEGFSLERRFFDHITRETDRGCWQWDVLRPDSGYGQFGGGNAHRWSFEFFIGEIPEGLQLDHLCRNRGCVNPWHLDPVPLVVNVMRGNGPMAINARKTHCLRGHEFTEANIYRPPGRPRSRACRKCIAIRARRPA